MILGQFARETRLPITEEELAQFGRDERLRRVAELAVQADLLPKSTALESLERRLAVVAANVRAARRYIPSLFPGRVALLQATEIAAGRTARDHTAGWARYTSEPMTSYAMPGDHLTMMQRPHVKSVAAALRREFIAGPSSTAVVSEGAIPDPCPNLGQYPVTKGADHEGHYRHSLVRARHLGAGAADPDDGD
jgi:thioesterase domain-containing protein